MRPQVACFISPFVLQEASRGDQEFAQKRLASVQGFEILALNEMIQDLAQHYFQGLNIPEKSRIDAFHLATAVWYEIDYVLSWNCKHIASGRVQKRLRELNERLNLQTPISRHPLCAPRKNSWRFNMWTDPIIDDLRRIRQEIEAECDHDFTKIYQAALKCQQQSAHPLVTKPIAKPHPSVTEH